ncbi:MAG: hypothetical protein JNM58_02620 [Xanthomonadaceae bacterium]|nr:hypothetical protein [Xanthomonadaceae bacterium]
MLPVAIRCRIADHGRPLPDARPAAALMESSDHTDSAPLRDYLRAGIVARDLPELHPLLAARDLLRAFSTLFHGGEENVFVRLLVLRAIGERGEAPDWSPQELRDTFAYLDPVKCDTVLQRLRDNHLLLWDGATQRYRISPVGRQALAAIGMLLQFNREGDELAYVTAQIAAGQAVGKVGAEDLQHLLSRLNELRADFDEAVLSGSEHRIHRAANTLQSVWQWVEKGTEIVNRIAADDMLDPATHRVAQQIGRAQSAMLRQASVFQRALNQLDRHRVHLGASGLSSSDVNRYLRAIDAKALRAHADDALATVPAPAFALSPIALDIAEFELIERERESAEDESLPDAQAVPKDAAIPLPESDETVARDWLGQLGALIEGGRLADLVPHGDFVRSAYRFSLLGLLGDPGAESRSGVSAELARIPLRWRTTRELEPVGRAGVAAISRSELVPFDGDEPSPEPPDDASDAPGAAGDSPDAAPRAKTKRTRTAAAKPAAAKRKKTA